MAVKTIGHFFGRNFSPSIVRQTQWPEPKNVAGPHRQFSLPWVWDFAKPIRKCASTLIEKYLRHVRRVYNLRIDSVARNAKSLDEQTLNPVSERIVWSAARMAALEGMGFGIGGFATLLPDMGMLAAITLRMLQKLSLVHGFEYSTPQEVGGLWLAAASAAGLDFTSANSLRNAGLSNISCPV